MAVPFKIDVDKLGKLDELPFQVRMSICSSVGMYLLMYVHVCYFTVYISTLVCTTTVDHSAKIHQSNELAFTSEQFAILFSVVYLSPVDTKHRCME